jgi:hypothetical protein
MEMMNVLNRGDNARRVDCREFVGTDIVDSFGYGQIRYVQASKQTCLSVPHRAERCNVNGDVISTLETVIIV